MNHNKKRIYIVLKGKEKLTSYKHGYDAESHIQRLRNIEKKKHRLKKNRDKYRVEIQDISKFKYWVMDKLGVLD